LARGMVAPTLERSPLWLKDPRTGYEIPMYIRDSGVPLAVLEGQLHPALSHPYEARVLYLENNPGYRGEGIINDPRFRTFDPTKQPYAITLNVAGNLGEPLMNSPAELAQLMAHTFRHEAVHGLLYDPNHRQLISPALLDKANASYQQGLDRLQAQTQQAPTQNSVLSFLSPRFYELVRSTDMMGTSDLNTKGLNPIEKQMLYLLSPAEQAAEIGPVHAVLQEKPFLTIQQAFADTSGRYSAPERAIYGPLFPEYVNSVREILDSVSALKEWPFFQRHLTDPTAINSGH